MAFGTKLPRMNHHIEDRARSEAGVFQQGGELLAKHRAPLSRVQRHEQTDHPHCNRTFRFDNP